MGKAGIVIGLEVSRLARNNADWHRLLEICALTETLILDEDGLYDPCAFNDRLLLGLKGQMSEAELHLLRARLRGGVLSKARRGELAAPLPIGLVYNPAGAVVLDPDTGVQQAIRHLFATFARTGSAYAVVKTFTAEGLSFPVRVRTGPNKGTLTRAPLRHHRVLQVLHNPRYAGAFVFGRRKTRKTADGHTRYLLQPRDQWFALIPDAHPGYLSWAEFEHNQQRLTQAAQAHGQDRRAGPPREGPALLQGLVICGRCGNRMTVRYHHRRDHRPAPTYLCQREGISTATPICASIPGEQLDRAIGALLLDTVTPLALEVALTVQDELDARADEADQLRRADVERARHAAELARRRYLSVDPDNRLVAASLKPTGTTRCARHHGQRGLRTRHPRRRPAARGRPSPHPRPGRRLPRALDRPAHPGPRAQTHGPAPDRRRHPDQGRPDPRPRAVHRRADHQPHPARPATRARRPPRPTRADRRDRPAPRPAH